MTMNDAMFSAWRERRGGFLALLPIEIAIFFVIPLLIIMAVLNCSGGGGANPFGEVGGAATQPPDQAQTTVSAQAPGWWRVLDKDWAVLRLDGTIPNSGVRRKVYEGNLNGATLVVVTRTVQTIFEISIKNGLGKVPRPILSNGSAYSVRVREKDSAELKNINIVLIDGTEIDGRGIFPDGWMWEVNPEGNRVVRINPKFFLVK